MPHIEKTFSSGFPTRSDSNQAVQLQKMTRGLKFGVLEDLYSENEGAD